MIMIMILFWDYIIVSQMPKGFTWQIGKTWRLAGNAMDCI